MNENTIIGNVWLVGSILSNTIWISVAMLLLGVAHIIIGLKKGE